VRPICSDNVKYISLFLDSTAVPFEVKIVVAKQTINLRKESLPWERIIHENEEKSSDLMKEPSKII
jgi:hypothetical protein